MLRETPGEFAMTVESSAIAARAQPEPLLTVEDLERMLKVDRRTVTRLWKRGHLPPPLKLGHGNRWLADEVHEAIERRAGERRRQEDALERLMTRA
jgi:predicted DNA-binding transcriptional regulator AlpA